MTNAVFRILINVFNKTTYYDEHCYDLQEGASMKLRKPPRGSRHTGYVHVDYSRDGKTCSAILKRNGDFSKLEDNELTAELCNSVFKVLNEHYDSETSVYTCTPKSNNCKFAEFTKAGIMIWKFIVSVIALVLVTTGTGNADCYAITTFKEIREFGSLGDVTEEWLNQKAKGVWVRSVSDDPTSPPQEQSSVLGRDTRMVFGFNRMLDDGEIIPAVGGNFCTKDGDYNSRPSWSRDQDKYNLRRPKSLLGNIASRLFPSQERLSNIRRFF